MRIGNGAYDQFQLDIYGETLNTLYEARVQRRAGDQPIRGDTAHGARRLRREDLAAAGRGHLGGPRPEPPALHPLEADGLGRGGSRREA